MPAAIKGVFAPRNLSLYTLTWNNPITLRDPDGRFFDPNAVKEAAQQAQASSLPPQVKVAAVAALVAVAFILGAYSDDSGIMPRPTPQAAGGGQKPPGGDVIVAAPAAPMNPGRNPEEGQAQMSLQDAHGNSSTSSRAQHGYEIFDTRASPPEAVKTGVSGGARTASGGSVRANGQANAWNKASGQPGRYQPRVAKEIPAGAGARKDILKWEAQNASRLRQSGQLRDPTKHVRP